MLVRKLTAEHAEPDLSGVEGTVAVLATETPRHRDFLKKTPPGLRLTMPRSLRGFLRDPATVLGLVIVGVAVMIALAAPLLAPHDPTAVSLENRLLGTDRHFPLGTDHLGRDELSRLLYGARATLGTASVVLAMVMAIAFTVGTISGYYGGWLDTALMGLVDLLLAFPPLILAVAIAGTLGPSLINVMIAMAAVWWAGYARLIRGYVDRL